MVIREDDSLGLFIGEPERGKIRRKDMSPMGEKVQWRMIIFHLRAITNVHGCQTSKYIAGCFFANTTGIFSAKVNVAAAADLNVTSMLQNVMNAGAKTQWSLLCRPPGVLEVRIKAPHQPSLRLTVASS